MNFTAPHSCQVVTVIPEAGNSFKRSCIRSFVMCRALDEHGRQWTEAVREEGEEEMERRLVGPAAHKSKHWINAKVRHLQRLTF